MKQPSWRDDLHRLAVRDGALAADFTAEVATEASADGGLALEAFACPWKQVYKEALQEHVLRHLPKPLPVPAPPPWN